MRVENGINRGLEWDQWLLLCLNKVSGRIRGVEFECWLINVFMLFGGQNLFLFFFPISNVPFVSVHCSATWQHGLASFTTYFKVTMLIHSGKIKTFLKFRQSAKSVCIKISVILTTMLMYILNFFFFLRLESECE